MNCGNYHHERVGLHCPFCTIRVLVKELREVAKRIPEKECASIDAALNVASETMRNSREIL